MRNDLPSTTNVVYVLTDRVWHDSGFWLESHGLADSQGNSKFPNLKILPLVGSAELKRLRKGRSYSDGRFFTELVKPHCKPDGWVMLDTGLLFLDDVLRRDRVMPNLDIIRDGIEGTNVRIMIVGYGVKVFVHSSGQNYAHLTDRIIGCAEYRGALSTMIYIGPRLEADPTVKDIQITMRRHPSILMQARLDGNHNYVDVPPEAQIDSVDRDLLYSLGPTWKFGDLRAKAGNNDKTNKLIKAWEALNLIRQPKPRGEYETILPPARD